METVKLTCREINGENRCFIATGDKIIILYAHVPSDDPLKLGLVRKRFVISNVSGKGMCDNEYYNARYYAEKYLEYCYCGYVYYVSSHE